MVHLYRGIIINNIKKVTTLFQEALIFKAFAHISLFLDLFSDASNEGFRLVIMSLYHYL